MTAARVVYSDAGLLACRELDDALGLTALAGKMLADARRGKNGRHALVGMLRQSVFGRLAGYEDVKRAAGYAAANASLDGDHPLVCLDETSKQLIAEMRALDGSFSTLGLCVVAGWLPGPSLRKEAGESDDSDG